jgi:acetyl-CoA synthetase (ADP-forming)
VSPRTLRTIPDAEARALLEARGVRFPAGEEAPDPEGAARAAEALRPPFVLKLLSPDLPHKTECGAVVLGLGDAASVLDAARVMESRVGSRFPAARLRGFRVEEQAPPAVAEVVIGGIRDDSFGPAVTVGAGGVLVELIRDAAWRLAPLGTEDALEAIRSTRVHRILDGWRGRPRADEAALAALLVAVGDLLRTDPRVSEVDLNPVLAYPDGAIAVDVRVLA